MAQSSTSDQLDDVRDQVAKVVERLDRSKAEVEELKSTLGELGKKVALLENKEEAAAADLAALKSPAANDAGEAALLKSQLDQLRAQLRARFGHSLD